MNRYVNVGIGLNGMESLQKHLCDSDNSRDVNNENKRERIMTVKRLSYLSMHYNTKNTRTNLGGTRGMPLKTTM
jgi:hypothetical protein